MSAVQIVNSTWFMPGWIGLLIGVGVGFAIFAIADRRVRP